MKVSLKTKVNDTIKVINKIKNLEKIDVLVGVPEETTKRKEDGITNAQLVAIHTKGSPLRNIPARPIIEPAITAIGNKERIAEDLKIAGQFMLEGKSVEAINALHAAGIDATNMIKLWFDDPRNNWPLLQDATIQRKGSDAILIDSAQMRNSITYVVNAEGK
jgi:hypothetical protein